MPDPAERFLAAAVAPLGDNAELQIMARRELEGCLVDGGTAELAEATAALELTTPGRRWRNGLFIATAVLSLISLGLLGRIVPAIPGFRMIFSPYSSRGIVPNPAKTEARLGKALNAEQRLLLFGDTSQADPAARFKALWNSDPGNAAYFADYSLHFIDAHDRLPPDFLETAAKLDPDNAWFTLVASGVTAKNSVRRHGSSRTQFDHGLPPDYTIRDQLRLDEAVTLLEKAAGQARFQSYQTSLTARRIALLPQRTDFASQLPGLVHLGGFPADYIPLSHATLAADAAAWQAADRGDAEGFRRLSALWDSSLRRWAGAEKPCLSDMLILRAAVENFAGRCTKTGLPGIEDLHDRWQPAWDRMLAERAERDRREMDQNARLKGGVLTGMTIPIVSFQVGRVPPITEADLKPGRMVDHELFARLSAAVAWGVFGLMLLAAVLYRQRAGLLVRRLSKRLEDILHVSDWAWILGAGVVLPFLFYLAIYRLTPLGARDWSITASDFLVPSGQLAAMGWLMIVLPVLIAGWRLGRRAALTGWGRDAAWAGWIAAGCGAVSLPLFGVTHWTEHDSETVTLIAGTSLGILVVAGRWLYGWRRGPIRTGWTAVICGALSLPVFGLSFARGKGSEAVIMIAAALLGILVLAWLIIGIRAVFSKRTALLRRVTLSRVLVPAYALGMLLMAASMPLYHAAEKRWLAQDRLMEITPEAPAMSRYEWEVAQAMRAELLEILNTK
jgi:hypothetical protein